MIHCRIFLGYILLLLLPSMAYAVDAQPVAVPYTLTDTNHILVRLKINGKGPYHFIVDTGAPAMILRDVVSEKLGLKPDKDGHAMIDLLEIEGGLTIKNAPCVVETPYQIEGMNAVGATGVDLDGMLGYSILSRFRLQIDLTKDHMLWTPIDYSPEKLVKRMDQDAPDQSEANLEAAGMLLKLLGPLIKLDQVPAKMQFVVGVSLSEKSSEVFVKEVFGESAAERVGVEAGDQLLKINNESVHSIKLAQAAMTKANTAHRPVSIVVLRNEAELTLRVNGLEGM